MKTEPLPVPPDADGTEAWMVMEQLWLVEAERLETQCNIGLFANPEAMEIHGEFLKAAYENARKWREFGQS